MKVIAILLICVAAVHAQIISSESSICPADKVCISREAAIKAVETAKELDAVKEQLGVERQAFEDLRNELNRQRIVNSEQAGRILELEKTRKDLMDALTKKRGCRWFSLCLF